MLGRHPALKIDVGKQRPRPRIRSAHGKPLEVEPERNHIRECLSAGEKFNSLLELGLRVEIGREMLSTTRTTPNAVEFVAGQRVATLTRRRTPWPEPVGRRASRTLSVLTFASGNL